MHAPVTLKSVNIRVRNWWVMRRDVHTGWIFMEAHLVTFIRFIVAFTPLTVREIPVSNSTSITLSALNSRSARTLTCEWVALKTNWAVWVAVTCWRSALIKTDLNDYINTVLTELMKGNWWSIYLYIQRSWNGSGKDHTDHIFSLWPQADMSTVRWFCHKLESLIRSRCIHTLKMGMTW